MKLISAILLSALLMEAKVTKQPFGKTPDGKAVDLYTLATGKLEARIMTYGGIVVSLRVPDRAGASADVIHGFDSLDGYLKGHPYFGALVGRYGNRIAKGKFKLGGKEYTLAGNNNGNHLHGGIKGFDKQVWTAREAGPSALELTYVSKDMEEGFPGTLNVKVVYTLEENGLKIDYTATTDKETIVNLTNHTYFNLAGSGDVLGHRVRIAASRFTPVDAGLIPTGELKPVAGTPFDFTTPHTIGERIEAIDGQIALGKGYDHNFALDAKGGALTLAAVVEEPKSGRVMEVWTKEPGLQFYTGNFLDGSLKGKGRTYGPRSGFCMETQHFPDSPNKPSFPSVGLKPGATYSTTTVYRFSAK